MIPMPGWIDTHCHLDDRRLRSRLPEVLAACREAGVVQVIAVATTADDSASVLGLAEANPGVFATVGIHPNEVAEAKPGDWERVADLSRKPHVVAIGETGLDRHWDRTPFELQVVSFQRHLALAHELDRAIVIHSRDCHADIVEQLAGLGRPVRGVLHSFTGNWDEARQILDLGLHLSFAGMITFANKSLDPLRDAAAKAPLDRILVETDAPYLSPHPHRGLDNEPARVAVTAAKLAELRGLSSAELAQATTANARALFNLPAQPTIS
jgi:TatD DNase family protein